MPKGEDDHILVPLNAAVGFKINKNQESTVSIVSLDGWITSGTHKLVQTFCIGLWYFSPLLLGVSK